MSKTKKNYDPECLDCINCDRCIFHDPEPTKVYIVYYWESCDTTDACCGSHKVLEKVFSSKESADKYMKDKSSYRYDVEEVVIDE